MIVQRVPKLEAAVICGSLAVVAAATDRLGAAWAKAPHLPLASSLRIAVLGTAAYLACAAIGGIRVARVVTALLVVCLIGHAAAVSVRTTLARDERPVRRIGPPPPPTAKLVDDLINGHPPAFLVQAANVTREEGRVIVNGSIDAPESIVVVARPQPFAADSYVTVEGEVHRGGVTVGLQRNGEWVANGMAVEPGRFSVTFRVPRSGEYSVAIANAVSDNSGWNNVEVSSIAIFR